MQITREHAEYIAKLAKLSFEGEELDRIAVDMAGIIDFADEINMLDTSLVSPMEHVLPISNVLRGDGEPVPYDRESILKNAPEELDGCFSVPKVVE